MKNTIIQKASSILTIGAVVLFATSCRKVTGDGPLVSETRQHSNFKAISSSIDATVVYTQGTVYSIELQGQKNVIDKIRSEVSDGELQFRFPNNTHFVKHDPVTIYITAPHVNNFTINGSGELHGSEVNVGDEDVHLKINGSGSMYLAAVKSGVIDADIIGSGSMRVGNGGSSQIYTEVSGSGDIDLGSVMARTVSTNTSGSGDTRIWATDALNVNISGSGDVYYRGTPRVSTSITGSGKVMPQ